MRERAIAKRYGTALFELALDKGRLDTVQKDLKAFSLAMKNIRLLFNSLINSEIPKEKRRSLILSLCDFFGCDELVVNLLLIMLDKERMCLIPYAEDVFNGLTAKAGKVTMAKIVVADAAVADDAAKRIKDILEQKLKRPAHCETEVDPNLIGGIMLKIGDRRLDASIRGRLDKLRQSLLQ